MSLHRTRSLPNVANDLTLDSTILTKSRRTKKATWKEKELIDTEFWNHVDKMEATFAVCSSHERLAMKDKLNQLYENYRDSVHVLPADVRQATDRYNDLLSGKDNSRTNSPGRSERSHASSRRSRASALRHQAEDLREEVEAAKIEALENARLRELEAEIEKKKEEIKLRKIQTRLRRTEEELRSEELSVKTGHSSVRLRSDQHSAGFPASLGTATRSVAESVRVRSAAGDGRHRTGFPVFSGQVRNDARLGKESSKDHARTVPERESELGAVIDRLEMPRQEVPTFDGDPLKYTEFALAFEDIIGSRSISYEAKLRHLIGHCRGRAHDAVRPCLLLNPADGYSLALSTLKERFGDNFKIARACVSALVDGPAVKASEPGKLMEFSDRVQTCTLTLASLGRSFEMDSQESMLKIKEKLPPYAQNRWRKQAVAAKRATGEYPTFATFAAFISDLAAEANDPVFGEVKPPKEREKPKDKFSAKPAPQARTLLQQPTQEVPQEPTQKTTKPNCIYCEREGHSLVECRKFSALSKATKTEFIKKNGLCFACLKQGHLSKNCTDPQMCKKCNEKHPTSLHREPDKSSEKKDAPPTNGPAGEGKGETIPKTTHKIETDCEGSCLSSMIVPVEIFSRETPSKRQRVYALLDSQSDACLIDEAVAEEIGSKGREVNLRLTTMTTKEVVPCHAIPGLVVRGLNEHLKINLPDCYTQSKIPMDRRNIPQKEKLQDWLHLRKVSEQLSPYDPEMEVGLLIGFNCSSAMQPLECVADGPEAPYGVRTPLGWSVVGRVHGKKEMAAETTCHRVNTTEVPPISPEGFMEMYNREFEEKTDQRMSVEDLQFLEVQTKAIRQREDGHFELPLPMRDQSKRMPNNRPQALQRLQSVMKRLKRDASLAAEYFKSMSTLLANNFAEKVPTADVGRDDGRVWYVPHHAVKHPRKDKIRIVYDCSAEYKGTSLNAALLKGPDLTNNLSGVIIRFRMEKIAVTCDIEAMFNQVHVKEEDRDLVRFLWFENGDLTGKPVDYRMTTHLFGASSSPSCANFALQKTADCGEDKAESKARQFIKRNFYVDDGLTSVSTEQEALDLVFQSHALCQKGGFNLRKFNSSSKWVVERIPQDLRAEGVKDVKVWQSLPDEYVLGVRWSMETDTFGYVIGSRDALMNRRGLLSMLSAIYDPAGWIGPALLKGRIILQRICREGARWDETLPQEIQEEWLQWMSGLVDLQNIRIPRCIKDSTLGKIERIELHHFSDASLSGYGVCSYLRFIDSDGNIACHLIYGKSRVAPMKPHTVPRLELVAAVASVDVNTYLQKELDCDIDKTFFWTDSNAVLGYIRNTRKRFYMFVTNRIHHIRQRSDPNAWNYVNTKDNPADLASRGTNSKELLESSLWWHGPQYLLTETLPACAQVPDVDPDDPEVRPDPSATVCAISTAPIHPLLQRIERFSDWRSAVRGVAFLRKVARKGKGVETTSLSLEDLEEAERFMLHLTQQHSFPAEMEALRAKKNLKKSSPLSKLDPYLDEHKLIRVGGRLSLANNLKYGFKHPIILPRKGHTTQLIIGHHHEKIHHQGQGLTVNEIRSGGYWVIACTKAVSSYIHSCLVCRRERGSTLKQKMGPLPEERTNPAPPFSYCGMDCFGPFLVKDGRREVKRYGLLITCLSSRAVHVEMLDDMTTDDFINGLRRFIAIRGNVRIMRSDQGSNFMGATHELKRALAEMKHSKLKDFLQTHGCDFVQNVPHASHMGGVWERQIRTIRRILDNMLHHAAGRLNSSSLNTFFCEAMAIVNNRPLAVNNLGDPTSPEAITPNHLLTFKSPTLPPPGEFVTEDLYAKKRWRRVQYLAQNFWTRWRKEYLWNLQERQKWQQRLKNLQINDVVLMDGEARNMRLAKVVEVYPGRDGLVRKVRLLVGNPRLGSDGRRLKDSDITYFDRPIHGLTFLTNG